ncbi:HNH endonuclease [Wohlfahrtiimonas chitiniclastica]|uniref:HNH endonuclease n=1 Tax=Wohlfahrtiimonas chitiniclastica TaxID=400946 RepID=UPI001BCFF1F2|nr:HNH endonuclease [Wohlfahrtiimonas chitiniclastica]MBS7835160.1 HNH endonuclease [Wohlfahrtiimonas chitiniclastica]
MNDTQKNIYQYCDGSLTAPEISKLTGISVPHIHKLVTRFGWNIKRRKSPNYKPNPLVEKIKSLSDGVRSSEEIANLAGCSRKRVQEICLRLDLPRLPQGAQKGEANHFYKFGRSIDLDGYVEVRAPDNHPYARTTGSILEHRLVMEEKIGRYLDPLEVVDHIDGLTLHNHPSNLRLFADNATHLKMTISSQLPNWSDAGIEKMKVPYYQRKEYPLVDNYQTRKARGDVRLQQILLAMLQLGKDSPYLLGTIHHLEKAGIDYSSDNKIRLALERLYP